MITLLAILLATVEPISEDEKAVTNLVIISDEVVELGLSRQALLDGGNGKVIDRSGTVVSHADVVALNVVATNINRIAEAVKEGVTEGMRGLYDVTNLIPSHAEHIALYLPPTSNPNNLMGEVISEGTDGSTDWQIVRYSQTLVIPPNRHIEYCYLDTVATVECVWDKWDKGALEHRCTFARPSVFRGKLIRSYAHDIFGGAKGFDFGSALVLVDGKPTFTGVWTNSLTGAEYHFRNGVLQKQTKEIEE